MALNRFLIVTITLLLYSCSVDVGYRIEDGKVLYERSWNAARGFAINEVDADPESFEILGDNKEVWARDKNYVFVGGVKLDFLNPKEFIVFNNLFGKDNSTVVCDYKQIPEADVKSFKVKEFKDDSGKVITLGIDKNAAYECFDGSVTRMPSDSINHFKLLKGSFYRDKNNVYWWDEKLDFIDVSDFKILSEDYIVDKDSVYYLNKLIKDADPKTFKVTGDFRAEDKNYKYESKHRVKSISGNEQIFSVEVRNEIDDKVKKPYRLNSGEVVQAWGKKDVNLKEVKVNYKDQLIFDLGKVNSGVRLVVHGLVIHAVKIEEIDSLMFSWTENESGIKREVTVDVKGIIPKNYNGGTLIFRVRGPDQVTAEFR